MKLFSSIRPFRRQREGNLSTFAFPQETIFPFALPILPLAHLTSAEGKLGVGVMTGKT